MAASGSMLKLFKYVQADLLAGEEFAAAKRFVLQADAERVAPFLKELAGQQALS
jgi:hypothetical protein